MSEHGVLLAILGAATFLAIVLGELGRPLRRRRRRRAHSLAS